MVFGLGEEQYTLEESLLYGLDSINVVLNIILNEINSYIEENTLVSNSIKWMNISKSVLSK